MTPGHAKALAQALAENVRKYEASFGEIGTPAQTPTNINLN